jgi:hypothetical protein
MMFNFAYFVAPLPSLFSFISPISCILSFCHFVWLCVAKSTQFWGDKYRWICRFVSGHLVNYTGYRSLEWP